MSSNSTLPTAPTWHPRRFLGALLTWIKWLFISAAVWCVLGILSAVQQQRIDAIMRREVMPWSFYFHIAEVNLWIYALLGPLIVVYTWKIHSAFRSKVALGLLHLLGFFSYVSLHALLRFIFAALHDPRNGEVVPRSFALYRQTFIYFFNDDIYMYLTFAAGAFGYHYYREIRGRELAETRLQAQLSTAQLQILKMQLQPHFLFNT